MSSTSQTRIAASGGVAFMTLAVFVLLVSIAQAAAPTPLRGGAGATYAAADLTPLRGGAAATYAAAGPLARSVSIGRRGGLVRTTLVPASTAALIGGLVGTAFLIAFIAVLGLDGRASRRSELAPVMSLVEPPSASPATRYEDGERKAA